MLATGAVAGAAAGFLVELTRGDRFRCGLAGLGADTAAQVMSGGLTADVFSVWGLRRGYRQLKGSA